MIGKRLRKANLLALKRQKRGVWVGDYPIGALRKNNTVCSCQMCRNPRHSVLTYGNEKLTVQKRRHNEKFKQYLKLKGE